MQAVKEMVERLDAQRAGVTEPKLDPVGVAMRNFDFVNALAAGYPHIRKELDRLWALEREMAELMSAA